MPTLRLISLLALLGLPLSTSSCTWASGKIGGMLAKKAAKKDKKTGEFRVVGVIEMVNPEQNYVLINCEQRQNLAPGTEIIAQSVDGTRVTLKVTPERKGSYITADIKEGVPQVRDIVLQQTKPGDLPPVGAATAAATASTEAAISGPPVTLTPVMQADYIPPLETPFQPMAPVSPAPSTQIPAPPLAAPPAAPPPVRRQPAESQPESDDTSLPPVIR